MGFNLTVYYNSSLGAHVTSYDITYVDGNGTSHNTTYTPAYDGSSFPLSNLLTVSITANFSSGYQFSYFQCTINGSTNPSTQNPYSYAATSGTLQIWAAEKAAPTPPTPTGGFHLTVSFFPESTAGSQISHYDITYVLTDTSSNTVQYYPTVNNPSFDRYNVTSVSIEAFFKTGYQFARFIRRINGSQSSYYSNPISYSATSGTFQVWAIESEAPASTFKITGFSNDPGVSSFTAYDNTTYETYSFPYTTNTSGRAYSNLPKNVFTFGANLNGSTTASGDTLRFTRWEYRVGSVDASPNYKYTSSFSYDPSNYTNADIYIWPHTNYSEWTLKPYNATAGTSYSVSVGIYQLYRFAISFPTSKSVTFSATNSNGRTLIGYLSTSSSYDSETGVPSSSLTTRTSSSISFSYTVSANTTYYFFVRASSTTTAAGSTTVLIGAPKPDPWSWTANQSRITAHSAVTNHGATTDFATSVWDDLCDKVNEVLVYAGMSWSSQFLSLANTKFSGSSNKTLTAAKFNSLRYNTDRLRSTGIGTQAAGNVVYGSYFTTITSTLNTYINLL